MKKINFHSALATIFGVLTSIATAIAVIDFETFDFKKVNDLMKLFVVVIPAIGGYMSQIKKVDKPE